MAPPQFEPQSVVSVWGIFLRAWADLRWQQPAWLLAILTHYEEHPGFPFKVLEVEGTNGVADVYERRRRFCDLGYLQEAYVDAKGRLLTRCPSEPVDDYVRKGGKAENTERRGCLCNGLMANIGLPQVQDWGTELPLFTGGDDLVALPLGSAEAPSYNVRDVINYLLS